MILSAMKLNSREQYAEYVLEQWFTGWQEEMVRFADQAIDACFHIKTGAVDESYFQQLATIIKNE